MIRVVTKTVAPGYLSREYQLRDPHHGLGGTHDRLSDKELMAADQPRPAVEFEGFAVLKSNTNVIPPNM